MKIVKPVIAAATVAIGTLLAQVAKDTVDDWKEAYRKRQEARRES